MFESGWALKLNEKAAAIRLGPNPFLFWASLTGVLTILAAGAICFPAPAFFQVAVLALLSFWAPALAVPALFISTPLDVVRPIAGLQVSLSELELALCALAFCAWIAFRRKSTTVPSTLDLGPLLWAAPFLTVILVSGFLNMEAYKVAPHLLRRGEPFLALCLAANALRGGVSRRAVRLMVPLALFVQFAVAAAQFHDSLRLRVPASFGNPSQFAGYLVLTAPFLVVSYLSSRGKSQLAFLYAGALSFLALLLAFSRTGMLAALAGSVAAWLIWKRRFSAAGGPASRPSLFQNWSRRKSLAALAHLVVLAALGLAAYTSSQWTPFVLRLRGFMNSSYQSESLKMSLLVRAGLLDVGLRIWADHPVFGVGPNGYARLASSYSSELRASARGNIEQFAAARLKDDKVRQAAIQSMTKRLRENIAAHVHNLPLQVAVDFGILGLFAFLYFILKLSKEVWRRARASPAAVAGLGMLAGAALHNLFDVTFPSLGLEMGLLLGVALSEREENEAG